MLDSFWRWLGTAPTKVVIIVMASLAMGFTGWLYSVESQARDIEAQVAVAAEQVRATNDNMHSTEVRLDRMEDKLDRLLLEITELQVEARRSRYSSIIRGFEDMQPQPFTKASPNPLLGRRDQ